MRKVFWVVRGRAPEFWHLLHRQAGSSSGVHGSGRFCLAHLHFLYWPLLETKCHQLTLTSGKRADWPWLGSSVGLTSGGAGLGTGVNSSLIPLVPLISKSALFLLFKILKHHSFRVRPLVSEWEEGPVLLQGPKEPSIPAPSMEPPSICILGS